MASASIVQRRSTVLFIGKTGSGKSRLINVLSESNVAQSAPSSKSTTKTCRLHQVCIENTTYKLLDTVGIADTDMSNANVEKIVKDFLQKEVHYVNWIIVTLSGADKMTAENTAVLVTILKFLELIKWQKNILFCITHADGWSSKTRERWLTSLTDKDILRDYHLVENNNTVFVSVADPLDLEVDEQETATRRTQKSRETLLGFLSVGQEPALESTIQQWRDAANTDRLEQMIKDNRKWYGSCTVL